MYRSFHYASVWAQDICWFSTPCIAVYSFIWICSSPHHTLILLTWPCTYDNTLDMSVCGQRLASHCVLLWPRSATAATTTYIPSTWSATDTQYTCIPMLVSSPDPFSRCTLTCTLWTYSIFYHWKEEELSFIMKNKTKGAKTGGKRWFSSQMYMADTVFELWEISNFLSNQWAKVQK